VVIKALQQLCVCEVAGTHRCKCCLSALSGNLQWHKQSVILAANVAQACASGALLLTATANRVCIVRCPQAASTCAAYSAALLALEALLTHPDLQPALISSSWQQWQQRWRDSLAACGPGSWEALLLHLALLGRHVAAAEHAIGREGFMRIATSCK
jgi:hypothetical protein